MEVRLIFCNNALKLQVIRENKHIFLLKFSNNTIGTHPLFEIFEDQEVTLINDKSIVSSQISINQY